MDFEPRKPSPLIKTLAVLFLCCIVLKAIGASTFWAISPIWIPILGVTLILVFARLAGGRYEGGNQ